MKKLEFLIILIFGFFSLCFADESITMTTYYPSPYGVYNELQLYAHDSVVTTCDDAHKGTMYYKSSDNQIYVCKGATSGWQAVGPKAWANFQGNPLVVNSSSGVSAIQRISAGLYRITWSTAFPNANYVVTGACNALGLSGTMFTLEGNNNPSSGYYGFKPASVDVGCRVSSSNTNADGDLVVVTAY